MSEITKPRAEKPNDDQMHWNTALRILQKIDPRLLMAKPSFKQRMVAWMGSWRRIFGLAELADARLSQHRRNASEVSAGVAIPLKQKQGEDRAFEIQVRVLEYAIQLRKTVHGGRKLTLEDLPQNPESEKKHARAVAGASGTAGADATVRDFVARIQEDPIPSGAQKDIVADYWNKLAFIAWERATLDKTQVDSDWLQRARKYIDIARAGQPNWTPAQLNLARILAAEGKKGEALNTLTKVLGKKKEAQVTSAVANAIPQAEDKPQHNYADVLRDLSTLIEGSKGNLTQLNYDEFHRRKRKARFARDREHTRKL
jgi:hypothetical protein